MRHYFIDVRDAQGMVRDEEGADFAHLEDALDEAKASARDLTKQYVDDKVSLTAICIEVCDSASRTIATLTAVEILAHPNHPEFKNHCSDMQKHKHC